MCVCVWVSHLGDEVDEWLGSQVLDALLIETGQVVVLGLPLRITTGVKRAVLYRTHRQRERGGVGQDGGEEREEERQRV